MPATGVPKTGRRPLPARSAGLERLLESDRPVLALAPMQDVTDLPFWTLLSEYGGPDVYWTEYSRVHSTSHIDRPVLEALRRNPTGRPAIAQLIGNDPVALARAAAVVQREDVVAVDLNLGCPAPVVYRKCAGGGLLREPDRIDRILGSMREAVTDVAFTVKTRIGFDDTAVFEKVLALVEKHRVDLLTVHARTVVEMYRSEVRYGFIRDAAQRLSCPVLANGNVLSPGRAKDVLGQTGAAGLMIGRGCIRNPWIFDQIRDHLAGREPRLPTGREVLDYVGKLYERTRPADGFRERLQVEKMKKYMNFVGAGIGDAFLHRIRRATTRDEFFGACVDHLDHDRPMDLVPVSSGPVSGAEVGGAGEASAEACPA